MRRMFRPMAACAMPALALLLAACAGGSRQVNIAAEQSATTPAAALQATFLQEIGWRGSGPGEFVGPTGIAANALDQVFVVDTGNDRVQQFDPSGRYVGETGGFGWSDRQFNHPLGVAVGGNLRVWVADTQNRRIVQFDTRLQWLGTTAQDLGIGSDAELGYPTALAVSSSGEVWYTDRDTDRLLRLSAFGEGGEFPGGTLGPGDLENPLGIAIGPDATIVVADTDHDRVVFYDQFGNMLRTWGEGFLQQPAGVFVTRDGDLIIADTGNDRVAFVNRLGRIIGTIGAHGTGPAAFDGPYDVAVTRDGHLWVTDSGNDRLQVFSLTRLTE